MPRKPKKSKEEKLAENFFPIDERDVIHAIEKKTKESDEKTTEEIGKKRRKTKNIRKNKKVNPTSKKDFSVPKINLKKEGYELIITEKPQAAAKISSSLGEYRKLNYLGVPYHEVDRNGKRIVVACAVGHLFTLTQTSGKSEVPVFEIKWVPNYMARKKGDFTKKYYDTLSKLVKDAGEITIATDYDVEGEVIGYNILRFVCGQTDANRMKFSTLTEKELNESYDEKSKTINWGQAIAGETRHYLDWIYGINFSRAIMNAIKSIGKFRIMSVGRVQGPALKMIVEREKQIGNFKSETYWQAFITIKNSEAVELKHDKDISKKSELEKFSDLTGKMAEVKTTKSEQIIPPNTPFNLTTLQTEAYKLHGITPTRTLQSAQSLYLAGVISYPRTSSQKLPPSINYGEILEKLSKKYHFEKLMTRKTPVEGKKTDSAHPSIYPTGQGSEKNLSEDEEKIYNIIVRRFLSLFCEDAIIDNKKITARINSMNFILRGMEIRKKAWMEIYPVKMNEKFLEDLNGNFEIIKTRTEEKQTLPPRRYSPASIISELEKRNLGTKATRTNILETLYDRNYIKEKSIEATPLGMSLIDSLEKYSPIIIDEKLTRDFEKQTQEILEAKKDFEKKERGIIEKAKGSIREIIVQFSNNEKKIGEELFNANVEMNKQRKEENTLLPCETCKKGSLIINYSKKTGRHFVACNAYPECRQTYSLPPGLIKKSDKNCDDCSFPMLLRIMKGKRPWEFCFNPNCKKNIQRIEDYKKDAENQNSFKS